MNSKLIIAACLALVLAGCGDKNEPATGSAEPGMMDKAKESASEMAEDAGEMATDAGQAVTETAGDMAEGASDMASDAYEATKETIHDAAQGVADATAPKVTDAETKEAMEILDSMEKAAEGKGQ